MAAWTEGYVAEIPYTHRFHSETSPALIALALLFNGVRPPVAAGAGFSACELGCGQGFGTNLLACVFPEGRFEAVDFNPAHIAGARRLAEEAGLDNVRFHEESFEEFGHRSGNEYSGSGYDYILLHGVWSWVNAANREFITGIIRRRLKPGGAVYLSYNCLPGWAALMPMRELLRAQVEDASGPLPARIDKALAFAGRFGAQVPGAAGFCDGLKGKSANYIAHEYLNRDWAPFYHREVAARLSAAKLSYAASLDLIEHLDSFALSPEAQALIAEANDPAYRETLRDYFINTRFRRDIFVKGAQTLTPSEQAEWLRSCRFGLAVPRAAVPEEITVPLGKARLQPELYQPLSDALAEGPRTLEALLAEPGLGRHGLSRLVRALTVFTGLGIVTPAPDDRLAEVRRLRARRFNAAVLERNRHENELWQLASPVLGTGIVLEMIERLFLLALETGQEPVEGAVELLRRRGQRLLQDGRPLDDPMEIRAEAGRRFAAFEQHRRPHLKALGIG